MAVLQRIFGSTINAFRSTMQLNETSMFRIFTMTILWKLENSSQKQTIYSEQLGMPNNLIASIE